VGFFLRMQAGRASKSPTPALPEVGEGEESYALIFPIKASDTSKLA
jgi:hypothetical protein